MKADRVLFAAYSTAWFLSIAVCLTVVGAYVFEGVRVGGWRAFLGYIGVAAVGWFARGLVMQSKGEP